MSNFTLVGDFHTKFGYSTPSLAEALPAREKFLEEEVREVKEATQEVLNATPENLKAAKAHLLKELIDVLYITYGTLQVMGVDADAAFTEVHRSNMSKTQSSPTSKAVKGEGYTPAQMEQFIKAMA